MHAQGTFRLELLIWEQQISHEVCHDMPKVVVSMAEKKQGMSGSKHT